MRGDDDAVPPTLGRCALLGRCTLLAGLLAASLAHAQVAPLGVELRRDASLTAGAAVLALVLASPYAAPGHCRFCGSGRFDDAVRARLAWHDQQSARVASDVLVTGVLPAGVLLNSALSARLGGAPAAFFEDTLVLAEMAMLTALANGASKDATARRRPSAKLGATGSSNRSFFSGHASSAFALAAAAGTLSTMRGYPSAPWVWAGGMTLATSVAYLRVAGDAHWASDVLAGAAIGGLTGLAVPWLLHRPRSLAVPAVQVVPAPGGFALLF